MFMHRSVWNSNFILSSVLILCSRRNDAVLGCRSKEDFSVDRVCGPTAQQLALRLSICHPRYPLLRKSYTWEHRQNQHSRRHEDPVSQFPLPVFVSVEEYNFWLVICCPLNLIVQAVVQHKAVLLPRFLAQRNSQSVKGAIIIDATYNLRVSGNQSSSKNVEAHHNSHDMMIVPFSLPLLIFRTMLQACSLFTALCHASNFLAHTYFAQYYCQTLKEEFLTFSENENEWERGLNRRRQRLASPTAQMLVAQTTRPIHSVGVTNTWAVGLARRCRRRFNPHSRSFSFSEKSKTFLLFLERLHLQKKKEANDGRQMKSGTTEVYFFNFFGKNDPIVEGWVQWFTAFILPNIS